MVSLRPWVDVGNVGSLALLRLETMLKARDLGKLAMPGRFFDFTRYRPTIYFEKNQRQVSVPNSSVTYARRQKGNDFLFLHLLEPHMLGELYVDSILKLFQAFDVKRYCLLGGMYDLVPHTRPLPVSGTSGNKEVEKLLRRAGVHPSNYQGPTTIVYLLSSQAPKLGIDTFSCVVHLPQYAQLEEDHIGKRRILEVLNHLYGFPIDPADTEQAESQVKQVSQAVDKDPQLKAVIGQLESDYDAQAAKRPEEGPPLSPEIERFLGEMGKRFDDN